MCLQTPLLQHTACSQLIASLQPASESLPAPAHASPLATLEAQVAVLKAQLANTTNEVDALKDAIRLILQDKQRGPRRSPPQA